MTVLNRSVAALGMTLAFGMTLSVSAQTAEQLRRYESLTPGQKADFAKAITGAKGGSTATTVKPADQPETAAPEPVPAPTGTSVIEARYAGRTDAPNLRQAQATRSIDVQLKQFGYELFSGTPSTFAPATDIPVPSDYVIGPGDTIDVQLFGKDNEQYSLTVSRDGRINFPEIGAISVAGLRFTDLRADLEKRVAEQMIGVKASISMGALRSVRVFVLGDVNRPGSYTVSSLSSMTNALFVSGGIKPIGSLRNVQLKRNGRVITRLDLYDLLLRGDTSDDARLQPGDVIFVPPIGPTAGVAGEVRRPAIYELRGEKSVKQLVEMAGGLLPTAVGRFSQLERLDAHGNLTLVELNLDEIAATNAALSDGDVLRVYPNSGRMDGIVLLAGNVRRPGGVAWHERMHLTDLIPTTEFLLPQTDLEYVVVRREDKPLAKVSVFSTRLSAAWADPASDANTLLEPRDQVFVFLSSMIGNVAGVGEVSPGSYGVIPTKNARNGVAPSNAKVSLASQSEDKSGGNPANAGAVSPSESSESTVADDTIGVGAQGGNPNGSVNPRGTVVPKSEATRDLLAEDLLTDRQRLLKPLLDELAAQATSGEPTHIVSVNGLVKAPGNYPLEPGMHVSTLIRAGGGLQEAAYTLGAEVTRYAVVGNERREVTHINVDLAKVLQGEPSSDAVLQAHDKLTIKRLPEWAEQLTAEVRGEVRFPGVYPIRRGERLSDLLGRAGGLTDQAFPEGSVFTREELRVKEQERLDTLAVQLESDIAAASLQKAQEDSHQAESLLAARSLLPQLRAAKATGRLVIDLPQLIDRGTESEYDVVLKGGDRLIIPVKTQEVTVIGEVQYPTSHLVSSRFDLGDYVNRSGGYTFKADDDRAYIIRANGEVAPAHKGWWIFSAQSEVRAGDTIVVPLNVERMRPLTLWTSVMQILYQIAVSVAVLHSIGAI